MSPVQLHSFLFHLSSPPSLSILSAKPSIAKHATSSSLRRPSALPGGKPDLRPAVDGGEVDETTKPPAKPNVLERAFSGGNSAIASSCLVGLLTGVGVVIFNNGVHEIRDLFWDGIPYRGASWLREEPAETVWRRVILVPACGGAIVATLNAARSRLEEDGAGAGSVKAVVRPVLKAMAACVTLGTGNSLGPEGPSVEIGASVARGVGDLVDGSGPRKLSLIAAGSAAGIASGLFLFMLHWSAFAMV